MALATGAETLFIPPTCVNYVPVQAVLNSRLHITSALSTGTGNLLFAYCLLTYYYMVVPDSRAYIGSDVLLRTCTYTGALCYWYQVRYVLVLVPVPARVTLLLDYIIS